MYNVLPLFRSHYSLGRSILTLEKPTGKEDSYPCSIFDLLLLNKLDTLVLVDDNISGLLQASKQADESKIKLVFGLRLTVTEDIATKDEASFKKEAKYIIFAKNTEGYNTLIKLWTEASINGFYYIPRIDFKHLKLLWNKNMILSVPFYDSFLFNNALYSHTHVPDLDSFNPTFFLENNSLPFDDTIKNNVENYCKDRYRVIPAQTILYKKPEDFLSYLTFRCLCNRGAHGKTTIERPELDHMGSDEFNFDKWKKTL